MSALSSPLHWSLVRPALALAALAAAVALVGCSRSSGAEGGHGGPGGGMPPAAVAVQKVSTSNVPAVYEYVGQTAGSRDVEVRADRKSVV